MYFATHSHLRAVNSPAMRQLVERDEQSFAKSMVMLLIALIILVGVAALFVSVMASIQYSQGIDVGSASLAESNANAAKEPKTPSPPADIPIYKGGSIATAGGYNEALAYYIVFPLGSVEQIQAFYRTEMAKAGWREYAGSSAVNVFLRDDGSRKVSLFFEYYGGSVRLRVLTSE